MNNYDEYKYGRTLQFFEAYYPYDVEDVHYTNVILSMNQCNSIDELITIRERVKEKIKKIGGVETLSKLPKDLIENLSKNGSIYSHQHWTATIQDKLRFDVNSCYDENVFRLLRDRESITPNACGECFINLSYCSAKYKEQIIDIAKQKADIDVTELLGTIENRYRDFEGHWIKYKNFKEGMNGYNTAKLLVENDYEYLKQFNWRLLPWQKSIYSKIDREERKKKLERARMLKERREEEERKKNDEEKRKRKWEKINNIAAIVIVAAIVLGIFIAILSSGMENWLFAIIIILCLLKMGFK